MNPAFTVWGSYKVFLHIPACNYPPNCCAAVSRQPTESICWLKPLHNYGAISLSTRRMTSAITNQGSQTGGEWRLKRFSAREGGRKLFLMSKMFWHPWVCLKWWGADDNCTKKHAPLVKLDKFSGFFQMWCSQSPSARRWSFLTPPIKHFLMEKVSDE